jgi:hypothetical protein
MEKHNQEVRSRSQSQAKTTPRNTIARRNVELSRIPRTALPNKRKNKGELDSNRKISPENKIENFSVPLPPKQINVNKYARMSGLSGIKNSGRRSVKTEASEESGSELKKKRPTTINNNNIIININRSFNLGKPGSHNKLAFNNRNSKPESAKPELENIKLVKITH